MSGHTHSHAHEMQAHGLAADEGHKHFRERVHVQRRSGMKALRLAFVLTAILMVTEFVGGYLTNSLALMADAGHMLTDAAALGLGLFAVWFSSRPATPERTYGYFRVEILAALVNGVTLVVMALLIAYEGYQRLLAPPPVLGGWMMLVAVAGLVANLICAAVLHGAHHENLNVRGAFLHVIGDILGSVGAIVAALLIMVSGLYVADAAISIVVSLMILYSAWLLVRDSVSILLEGAPAHINVLLMKQALSQVDGVRSIHDLHVWTLTSGIHAMSCHAVVASDKPWPGILKDLSRVSRSEFNIHHTTIQIEEDALPHCENSC